MDNDTTTTPANPFLEIEKDVDKALSDTSSQNIHSGHSPYYEVAENIDNTSICESLDEKRYNLCNEIDNLCAGIFESMGMIDNTFAKIGKFFHNQANLLAAGRDPQYLSNDENQMVDFYNLCSFATKGLGNIVKAVKNEFSLRTEIFPRLKMIANEKLDLVIEMIDEIRDLQNADLNQLMDVANTSLSIRNLDYGKNTGIEEKDAIVWRIPLKNWRNSYFHLLYLQYWKDQFTDWKNDIFSTPYTIPDMEDVNAHLLFDIVYANDIIDKSKSMKESLNMLRTDLINIMSCKKENYVVWDAILVDDQALMATFQAHNENPYELRDIITHISEMGIIQSHFLTNGALSNNYNLWMEDDKLEEKKDNRSMIILTNGLLLIAIICMPAFFYWSWYWALAITFLVGAFIFYRCKAKINKLITLYESKQERLRVYAVTCAHRMAGESTQPRKVSDIVNTNGSIFGGMIIGAIIGIIGSLPGIILGAIIGAILGGGFDEIYVESNGEDWDTINTGTGNLAKVIMWLLIISTITELILLIIY